MVIYSTFFLFFQHSSSNSLRSRDYRKENLSRRTSGECVRSFVTSSRAAQAAANHNDTSTSSSRSKRSIRLRSLSSTPSKPSNRSDVTGDDVGIMSSVAFADRKASSDVPEDYTKLQVAQLYAHIATMPDCAKKRRLLKKVIKGVCLSDILTFSSSRFLMRFFRFPFFISVKSQYSQSGASTYVTSLSDQSSALKIKNEVGWARLEGK